MPVKQHTDYHLVVKIVEEGEQEQRKARSNPMQEEQ